MAIKHIYCILAKDMLILRLKRTVVGLAHNLLPTKAQLIKP